MTETECTLDKEANRILQWESGETPGPWRATFFPTNRCNLRCKICWQRCATDLEKTQETPDARLLELVDECADAGVQECHIVGGGEPLIRGDLVLAMCERIRARGMQGLLQTNGTLLSAVRAQRLIDIGWPDVCVSLDGPTRKINDDIRSEPSFDKATENIRALADLRRRHERRRPAILLCTVVTSTNYDKLDQMVQLAHELGCDAVHFTTMLLHHPEAGDRFSLTEQNKRELPSHLHKAAALAKRYRMIENFDLYLREEVVSKPGGMFAGSQPSRAERGKEVRMEEALCFEPWLAAVVSADGRVGPCCAFWDSEAQNIQETTFRDAWLGPYMQSLRERMLIRRPPSSCASCSSVLFTRTQLLRRELQAEMARRCWQQMGIAQRSTFLLQKVRGSLRQHGLGPAFHRGCEWFRVIHRK